MIEMVVNYGEVSRYEMKINDLMLQWGIIVLFYFEISSSLNSGIARKSY